MKNIKILDTLKTEAIEETIWSILDKFDSNNGDIDDEVFLIEDAKLFWIVLSSICFALDKEEIKNSALVIHSLLNIYWGEFEKITHFYSPSRTELMEIISTNDNDKHEFIKLFKKTLPYAVVLHNIISPKEESGSQFFSCVSSVVCSELGLFQARELMQDEYPNLISEEDFVTPYHQMLAISQHFDLDFEDYYDIELFNRELDKVKNEIISENDELDSEAIRIICDQLKITF